MKNLKKLAVLLTTATMAITLMPFSTAFAEVTETGTATDKTVIITSDNDWTDDSMYYMDLSITKVIISEGVTKIPDTGVFVSCENLTEVSLPSTLKTIGYGAFMGSGIKNIVIPASVESINGSAFAECPNLSTVVFQHTTDSTLNIISATTVTSDQEVVGNVAFAKTTGKPAKIYTSNVSIANTFTNRELAPQLETLVKEAIYTENEAEYKNILDYNTDKVTEAMTTNLDKYNKSLSTKVDTINIAAPEGSISVGYTFNDKYWFHDFETNLTDANVKLGIILYNIPEGTKVSQPMVFID